MSHRGEGKGLEGVRQLKSPVQTQQREPRGAAPERGWHRRGEGPAAGGPAFSGTRTGRSWRAAAVTGVPQAPPDPGR